jgi:lysophospholipase L1-like esterase
MEATARGVLPRPPLSVFLLPLVLVSLIAAWPALAQSPAAIGGPGAASDEGRDREIRPRRTIVMLGDSLTAGGEWDRLDPEARILNHGKTGDGHAQILKRLDRTISAKPDLVFLQVGVNDLANSRDLNDIAKGHSAIWSGLREALPGVRIIVCSLIPINEGKYKRGRAISNQRVMRTNELLAERAAEENLEFVDLYLPLSDQDQALPGNFTFDGIHLNKAGQTVWLDRLKRHLAESGGPPAASDAAGPSGSEGAPELPAENR